MSKENPEDKTPRQLNRQPSDQSTFSRRAYKNYKTLGQGDNDSNRNSDSPVGNHSLAPPSFTMVVFDTKLDFVLKDLLGVPIDTKTNPTRQALKHHGIN